MNRTSVAVIGSGNIGTDLMLKVLNTSKNLRMGALVGIDAASDGLARARSLGVATTAGGIDGLVALPQFRDIAIVFDATSAGAHARHDAVLREHGKRVIDLTPAAIGPYVIPVVNLDEHLGAPNINIGHVRRTGDHSDRARDLARLARPLRRDRGLDREQIRRARNASEHR